jgi:tetratricopeptide (TPR) repeat protein
MTRSKEIKNNFASWFQIIVTVITTATLVMTFFYSNRIDHLEIELKERQTNLNKTNFFAELMDRFIGGNECDRIISVELMKNVDDTLAYDLLEAIAKNDCSSKVKRKAIDVIAEKGIIETQNYINNTSSKEIIEQPFQSKANTVLARIITESPTEEVGLVQKRKEKMEFYESLQFGKTLFIAKKYKESIPYYQKAYRLVYDKSKLDKAAYVLAKNHLKKNEIMQAATQFNKAFINFKSL